MFSVDSFPDGHVNISDGDVKHYSWCVSLLRLVVKKTTNDRVKGWLTDYISVDTVRFSHEGKAVSLTCTELQQ